MDEKITSIRYGFHAADLLGDFPGVEEYDVEANAARSMIGPITRRWPGWTT